MHIITNIFFIFLFLMATLFAKIPNIHNSNYIEHKFILFISLFCFQFVISILSNIINKCKIYIKDIAFNSLLVATAGVIGYSLYNDFQYMGVNISFFNLNDKYNYINVAIILTLFITVIQIIKLIISSKNTDCIKYE